MNNICEGVAMGKRYDMYVTPQNTPCFKERRRIFLAAMGIFLFNLVLMSVFLFFDKTVSVIGILCTALFASAQFFDNRREMWTWGYVLFWCIFTFFLSAVFILWYKAYFWFVGYGIELVIFIAFVVWNLKRYFKIRIINK